MHIMVFGINGKVGSELIERLTTDHITGLTRADADLSQPLSAAKWIATQRPDVVINCAAMNGMESVAKNPHLAFLINAAAPAVMAHECAQVGALFIHYSTDYVFNGSREEESIEETWTPHPTGVYGWTKRAGEDAVTTCGDAYYIFRLSTIYGRQFAGPLDPITQAAKGAGTLSNPIKVIRQFCAPTSARLVADATAHAIKAVSREGWREARGIYHLATREGAWRHDFVAWALAAAKVAIERPLAFKDAKLPLPRPLHSFLCSDKFQARFGYKLPTWREDLAATLPLMERPAA